MSVKIVTSLHYDGYMLYGKNLDSWVTYFPDHWNIEYYAENHIPNFDKRILIKDFNLSCSKWNEFYSHIKEQTSNEKNNKKLNWYRKALRWSFKMFVLIDALENSTQRYVVWLDADVYAVNNLSDRWIEQNLNKKCFAAKLESIQGQPHIESGILIFDTKHTDTLKFVDWIKHGYFNKQILLEKKPWDGFWLAKFVTKDVNYSNINMFSKNSCLVHCVGDKKFPQQISGRSGRTKKSELI